MGLTMTPSEVELAATADELLGLDLRVFETWDVEQRSELRRVDGYLRNMKQGDVAYVSTIKGLTRRRRSRVVAPQPKSNRGFGGSAVGVKQKRGRGVGRGKPKKR